MDRDTDWDLVWACGLSGKGLTVVVIVDDVSHIVSHVSSAFDLSLVDNHNCEFGLTQTEGTNLD